MAIRVGLGLESPHGCFQSPAGVMRSHRNCQQTFNIGVELDDASNCVLSVKDKFAGSGHLYWILTF